MAIYFLRHGESMANVANVFAGQREDSDLTERGIEQAEIAGVHLADANIHRIISSSLTRTTKTAKIAANAIGIDDITVDDRLLEYDMGSLTGKPRQKITSQELINADGAEKITDFQYRVLSILHEIKDSPDNILLVSHAGVGRIIEATKQQMPVDTFYSIQPYPNAQAIKLDLAWLK